MTRRPAAATALAAVLAIIASAACGGAAKSGASTADTPTVADRRFVADMIPHHHLGMALLDEAARHSYDVRLRRLAFEMNSYHQSELDQLHAWADDWGVAASQHFDGDLASTDVDRLLALHDLAHDTWWLHLMIDHHRGALTIAARERDGGAVTDARQLAERVDVQQRADIDAMVTLLDELCGEAPGAPGC